MRRLNALEENNDSKTKFDYLGELKFVNQLESKKLISAWLQILKVNGKDVIFKVDTGVQVNIIPKREILK